MQLPCKWRPKNTKVLVSIVIFFSCLWIIKNRSKVSYAERVLAFITIVSISCCWVSENRVDQIFTS